MKRSFGRIGAAVLFAVVAGCGETGSGTRVIESPAREALTDLASGLKSLAESKKRPPARLSEFEPVEPMFPVAGPAIRNNEIVYVWGAGLVDGSSKIIGYAKTAPAEGGWVLLQNGTVREMTAAEFASAPKEK